MGITARRLTYVDDLCISFDENILVIDNGCDQSIVNINSSLVQYFAGIYYNVGGAISTMKSKNLELVNEAFTLVFMPDGGNIILKILNNDTIIVTENNASPLSIVMKKTKVHGLPSILFIFIIANSIAITILSHYGMNQKGFSLNILHPPEED